MNPTQMSASKIVASAMAGLSSRQKEVLTGRFGLAASKNEGETLAAIGDRMGITRERVRQIEAAALAAAKSNLTHDDDAVSLAKAIRDYIAAKGGVMKKADVVSYASTLVKNIGENQIDFLSEASAAFNAYREDDDYYPFYYVSEKDREHAQGFVDEWAKFLKSKKSAVLTEGMYRAELAAFSISRSLNEPVAANYLSVTKRIRSNQFGDVGLREWPEINPTTIRDKIYLVLKKGGEPLHFEAIAKRINEIRFDEQFALAPTVHNELIKDDRFVLVGRGMYGLREHGYEPGTAREVIANVLKNEGPMKATDVVSRVNARRFFKENTILINLQNKSSFERMPDGRYRVRES